MEGYQNYQQVINAIKAEYVNARNLKKTAIAKKRVATNTKSFKTRKEGEKTTLETKLIAVKSDLDSTLSTAINNLEDAKFDTLKSELSKLKGKLAFIDAEIIRLEEKHSIDPENISASPSADPTTIESQSLTVLKNMLSVTISDAESVINNLYTGQDYAAIKSATVPRVETSTEQEVRSYYQNLKSSFDQLFDKTKEELDNFVFGIFFAGDGVNDLNNQLINYSSDLVTFKSQLADLLNDEGTEAEINAKEQQIEDLKEIMLSKATELKQMELSIGSGMSDQKLVKLKRYATDLNSLTDELRNYRWENHGFLKNQFPNPDFDIAYRSFVLYSGVFEFMDNNQSGNWFTAFRGFNNGQSTEFTYLKQLITQAKEYYRTDSQFRDNAYDDTNVLYQTQELFDCDQRNGNRTEYYNIRDFRPEVSQETKDFYVNYSRQLHNATSNYTSEMHKYKFYKNAIQQHIQDFEEIVNQQNVNISALRFTKRQKLWLEEDMRKRFQGHYKGTPEQEYALSNTRGAWFEAEAEYLSQFYLNKSKMKKFDLYNTIFPEFYSTLSILESNLDNLNNNMSSLDLQTSTVDEAEYVTAFADYKSKVASFESIYAEWINMMNGPESVGEAYDFLQTTLVGEAEYQDALPEIEEPSNPPLYTQEYVNNVTALHNAYLNAQSDYDTKLSNKDAYYDNIVNPAADLRNDAYTFLRDLQDLTEYAAYNDWAIINGEEIKGVTTLFIEEVAAHFTYNSAVEELNQYLLLSYGSEFNLSYSGSTLKGFKDEKSSSEESLQQAESAKSTTLAAFMDVRNGMTIVESTPLEKRQGMGMQIDVHRLYKQVERLESLAIRYSEIFPIMVNQAGSFASEVRSRDEAYFTGLFQSVKDFMDGVYSNNLGDNLYMRKLNDMKSNEIHAGKKYMRLDTIFKPLLRDWNMSFGSNNNQDEHINIADVQYNAIQRLSTDTGIDWFRQTISNINNELFRNVDGFSFGDRIINEVNNGTPLI